MMNYHQKSGTQKKERRILAKVRNANKRQNRLQSLEFLISSKANYAANQADNIIAIVVAAAAAVVVKSIIMVKSELLI